MKVDRYGAEKADAGAHQLSQPSVFNESGEYSEMNEQRKAAGN